MQTTEITPTFRDPTARDVMKAGKYLVIDPCYIFGDPDSLWSQVCKALYPDRHHGKDKLIMNVDGHDVYIFGTAYGDGSYPVYQDGMEKGYAGVDAGLLCFIPDALLDELDNPDTSLGVYVTTDCHAGVCYEDGNASLANVEVVTGESEEDEDEEEEEYDDEDEEDEDDEDDEDEEDEDDEDDEEV